MNFPVLRKMSENINTNNPPQLPPAAPAATPAATLAAQINSPEFITAVHHIKWLFVFLVVLFLKFVADNLMIFCVFFTAYVTFNKICVASSEQISMKARSKRYSLIVLVVMQILLLFYAEVMLSYFLQDSHVILKRWTFESEHEKKYSCVQILWRVMTADLSVLILCEVAKMIQFLILFANPPTPTPVVSNSEAAFGTSQRLDIESGTPRLRSLRPAFNRDSSPRSATEEAAAIGTDPRTAVTQRVTSLFSAMASDLTPDFMQRSLGQIWSPSSRTNDSVPSARASDSSDYDCEEMLAYEGSQYLKYQRLALVLDVVALILRTVLPIPLWTVYLYRGTTFSSAVIPSIYFAVKFGDLVVKQKALLEAVKHAYFQISEYGRRPTGEELLDGSECPVCFDTPRGPVILSCKHIFCESCIHEWLAKESTCPVCRCDVPKEGGKNLVAIKSEINARLPILM